MELAADLDAPCPPEELFAWVDDLARYPSWLSIVTRAEAYAGDPPPGRSTSVAASARSPGRSGCGWCAPASSRRGWPCSSGRSTTAASTPPGCCGPRSARWAPGTGSHLAMRLHYDGALWGPVLERLLADEIEQGRLRLLELVSAPRR